MSIKQFSGYTKYRAKKTEIDGITFDSRKEATRYVELKAMEKNGDIIGLELQKSYELQPSFEKNGKKYRAITYRADFVYRKNGRVIVEDVKGVRTDVYKLKRKLFEYHYPGVEITEI